MREHDRGLADEVLEPTFVFMRSQTDRARLHIKELGEYLQYREKDVGKAYVKIDYSKIFLPKSNDQDIPHADTNADTYPGCCRH